MKINQNDNNVSFKSAFPARVFIDGKRAVRPESLRNCSTKLEHILTNPAKGDKSLVGIKTEFSNHVKDFNYFGEKVKVGEVIRNIVGELDGIVYFFTGAQARELNAVGKKIGPEKHFALNVMGSTKSYEASAKVKAYFDKAREILSYPKLRLKSMINPKTNEYMGDELILNIYAKSAIKKGKKEPVFEIERISFQSVKPEKKVVNEVKPLGSESVAQNTKHGKKSSKNQKGGNDQLKIDF